MNFSVPYCPLKCRLFILRQLSQLSINFVSVCGLLPSVFQLQTITPLPLGKLWLLEGSYHLADRPPHSLGLTATNPKTYPHVGDLTTGSWSSPPRSCHPSQGLQATWSAQPTLTAQCLGHGGPKGFSSSAAQTAAPMDTPTLCQPQKPCNLQIHTRSHTTLQGHLFKYCPEQYFPPRATTSL